ncbi:hypothetical protein E2C01_069919 [Portunus trituberculatus]|uniref:Uncharacterized protein n=1 Tax=Portunus trituberculatus TaxID=210409 RepID=A0A5B7I0U0_PORTR|nr:hypothetical protein [Portunus trituberculatus]
MHLLHTLSSFKIKKTTNVPRSDCSSYSDPKCLDTSLNFFFISFCNIRGLRSNFQSVEHYLSSTKPHLFLTETQLSEATDSSPFSVPSYFLYSHFLSKVGCCTLCTRTQQLFSSFYTMWAFHRNLWAKGDTV